MNAWKYAVLFTFFACAAPALRGEEDPWADRSNVALSFLGAEALIRDGSGVEHEAGVLINGLTSDESAVQFRFIPAEIIVTLPSLTSVEAVRLFPG